MDDWSLVISSTRLIEGVSLLGLVPFCDMGFFQKENRIILPPASQRSKNVVTASRRGFVKIGKQWDPSPSYCEKNVGGELDYRGVITLGLNKL